VSTTVTSAEKASEAVVPWMLVRDDIEKPNAFPAFTVMLPADGPAFQVPLAEVVVPDVSCTTDQALPPKVCSTETPQFVETQ
jgi:hypothetical protein